MKREAVREAALVGVSGCLLYAAAAGFEGAFGADPVLSAFLEELGKTALLLGFAGSGPSIAPDGNPLRHARTRALGLARRLSLGLVAVAVFAGVENLAYLVAFPEFGVLGRLLWSLPVHLVAALLEGLGILFGFRWWDRKPGVRWRLAGGAALLGGLASASVWHGTANVVVSGRLASGLFAGGVAVALLLFLVLLTQFLRQAYLGGFLHGAD